METLGTKLEKRGGIGPGFDFLRVFLALSVVATHSYLVTGIEFSTLRFVWFANYWALAMFFSLSGFLIAGSALRLSLRDFMINRSLRIVPALAFEVMLAAFILGPIVTTLPLHDYFGNLQTWHYMTNMIGWINYELPGVFRDHPNVRVNGSLWTVPYEVACYGIMSFLIYFKLLKRPKLILAAAFAIAVIGLLILASVPAHFYHPGGPKWGRLLNSLFMDMSSRLFVTFLMGIGFYLLCYKIPYDFRILILCLIFCIAISAIAPGKWSSFPLLNLICAPVLAYIMAFVGVSEFWKLPLFGRGDYSYGIYLYGFPIQQMMVSLFPKQGYLFNFFLSVPFIVVMAMLSWHLVEKPVMRLRKRFSFVARQRLERDEGEGSGAENVQPQGNPQAS